MASCSWRLHNSCIELYPIHAGAGRTPTAEAPTTMRCTTHRPVWLRHLPWLAWAWLALGVQAATVDVPVDLLQVGGGMTAPAAGALERALTIDTSTSQRNLDLLLEARRAGETVSPMRSGGLPAQPQALPAVQPRGNLVPLGLQSQDSVTAPGAAERREWQGGAPGRAPAGPPGSHAGLTGAGHDTATPGRAGGAEGAPAPARIVLVLDSVRDFVRDNRFELLTGVALLALAGAGMQALARRR